MPIVLRFIVPVFFVLFPFFEGCESATGTLLIHTLTISLLLYCFARSRRVYFPPLLLFLPFLLYLIVSCMVAPYKYSAFLSLWRWWAAALLAMVWTTLMREGEPYLKRFGLHAFLAGGLALILSAAPELNSSNLRWNGSFVNPNDFGAYSALLLLFGIFQLERVVSRSEKILVWILLACLALCVAMASSRSVFLAISTVTLLYLWKRKPPRWVIVSISGFLVVSAIVLTYRLLGQDPFQYYRFRIWKYSLLGILNDPYFGIGLNMLQWKAAQFNFPADVLLGRFGMIATSTDNQYLQILAEGGFVGFFLFLIGWTGLYLLLRQVPERFSVLRYSTLLLMSIVSVFSLPLNNTSILSLFLFTVLFAAVASEIPLKSIELTPLKRILAMALLAAVLLFAVLIPFAADREFRLANTAPNPQQAYSHLQRATALNPFQPYYLISRLNAQAILNPPESEEEWLHFIEEVRNCIRLNPLDSTFNIYQAKIYRTLHQTTKKDLYAGRVIESYQRAKEKAPYQVFQRAEFAYYLYTSNRLHDAEKELTEMIELEPAYLNARLLLVELKLQKGDRAGARREMEDLEMIERRLTSERAYTNYTKKLVVLNTTKKKELLNLLSE